MAVSRLYTMQTLLIMQYNFNNIPINQIINKCSACQLCITNNIFAISVTDESLVIFSCSITTPLILILVNDVTPGDHVTCVSYDHIDVTGMIYNMVLIMLGNLIVGVVIWVPGNPDSH